MLIGNSKVAILAVKLIGANMHLITEPYFVQAARWPATGRHILAQYDDNSIIVYQAYNPTIGYDKPYPHFG
jgi:hypothetical protein